MGGEELQRTASIKDLSTGDVVNLIGKQDSKTASETLALLYCRRQDISSFLKNTYDFTPEVFVETLKQDMSTLTDSLPKEYALDLSFNVRTRAGVSAGDANSQYLDVFCGIVSQDALKSSYDWYESEKLKNPALNDYETFRSARTSRYSVVGSGMKQAGFFDFQLSRESIGQQTLDNLRIQGIELKSKSNISTFEEDTSKYLPVPLRHDDGSQANISNKFIEVGEGVLNTISSKKNSIGIATTTAPTKDGKKVLGRQGYKSDLEFLIDQSGPFKKSFLKTGAYDLCQSQGGLYKIVHSPTK